MHQVFDFSAMPDLEKIRSVPIQYFIQMSGARTKAAPSQFWTTGRGSGSTTPGTFTNPVKRTSFEFADQEERRTSLRSTPALPA